MLHKNYLRLKKFVNINQLLFALWIVIVWITSRSIQVNIELKVKIFFQSLLQTNWFFLYFSFLWHVGWEVFPLMCLVGSMERPVFMPFYSYGRSSAATSLRKTLGNKRWALDATLSASEHYAERFIVLRPPVRPLLPTKFETDMSVLP